MTLCVVAVVQKLGFSKCSHPPRSLRTPGSRILKGGSGGGGAVIVPACVCAGGRQDRRRVLQAPASLAGPVGGRQTTRNIVYQRVFLLAAFENGVRRRSCIAVTKKFVKKFTTSERDRGIKLYYCYIIISAVRRRSIGDRYHEDRTPK